MLNNTSEKKFSTDPLDDAMRELLDICQQYNNEFSTKRQHNNRLCGLKAQPKINNLVFEDKKDKTDSPIIAFPDENLTGRRHPTLATNCDINLNKRNEDFIKQIRTTNILPQQHIINNNSSANINKNHQNMNNNMAGLSSKFGSIEKLQQKQSELQNQLDEVLQIAKSLEIKQKRKLKCILEDSDDKSKLKTPTERDNSDEDDDELIEFQQIENELRISELNRQLSNIQEELRLRLYKRLLSNTTNGVKTHLQQYQHQNSSLQSSTRRNSTQTDESTTPSSSCSDEQTTASSSSASTSTVDFTSTNARPTSNLEAIKRSPELGGGSKSPDNLASKSERPDENKCPNQLNDENLTVNHIVGPNKENHCSNNSNTPTDNHSVDLDSAVENSHGDYETSTSTTSKESIGSSVKKTSPNENDNIYINMSFNNISSSTSQSVYSVPIITNPTFNNNCMRSGASDLSRIEEDEENGESYYCDSDRFRTIYEEKLSPIIKASTLEQKFKLANSIHNTNNQLHSFQVGDYHVPKEQDATNQDIQERHQNQLDKIAGFSNAGFSDNSFNTSNVNSDNRSNRPLTLYLPKPDEEIDLIEHVQALGHDLNIISDDLNLSPTSAHGYLYKSCSKNSKKWLKRYFFFDRRSKVLSYYENNGQLVKKNCAPKSSIPFNEIGDVYVDHRLSGMSEKDKSSKKNYVFVLATIKRKYLLASSRAETMRAWIDILFTAAKANDYFQQMGANGEDENYEFQDY